MENDVRKTNAENYSTVYCFIIMLQSKGAQSAACDPRKSFCCPRLVSRQLSAKKFEFKIPLFLFQMK